MAREERQYPRHRIECVATIATLDAELDAATGSRYYVVTSGTTLDVGDGGAALVVESPVEEGRRVIVEVQVAQGRAVERFARVVWTAKDANASYIGLMFDEPIPGLAHSI